MMQEKPRVVFTGILAQGGAAVSRASQRLETLERLGFDVEAVPWQIAGAPTTNPRLSAARYKLGLPVDEQNANRRLLELARDKPFELLWIDRAMAIWPWTIYQLRRRLPGLAIGMWLEEHLAVRINRSMYMGGVIPQCDVIFTDKIQNLGCRWLNRYRPREVVLVDDTYDPEIHAPTVDLDKPFEPAWDVSFVGTFERNRAEQMHYLAENGVRVSIWGAGWKRFTADHPNLIIAGTQVHGREYAHVLCTSRISLCFLRKANQDRQTNRTMEIPACGGFMLAERTSDHMRLFAEGKEAAFFSSRKELLSKVRYYLEHDDERAAIARAGRKRLLDGQFTHADRLTFMIDLLMAKSRDR